MLSNVVVGSPTAGNAIKMQDFTVVRKSFVESITDAYHMHRGLTLSKTGNDSQTQDEEFQLDDYYVTLHDEGDTHLTVGSTRHPRNATF